jgi:hypothetical protein
MPRGRRIRNLAKKGLKFVGQNLKGVAEQLLPALKKHVTQAIMSSAEGGIPFRTSGMVASKYGTPMRGQSKFGPRVSVPSANGKITYTGSPVTKTMSNGNSIVHHREYVVDLAIEEDGFDLQYKFGINPGNASLFPWLSQIATRYDSYKIKSFKVIYEPQCGTSISGTVMIAIDSDASDPPPTSKTQMMSYKNAARSPVWFACEASSAPQELSLGKTNYVLSGAQPIGTDIKTYDIGNLYVAVQSDAGSLPIQIGELYVEYVVELMTPQITSDYPSASLSNTNSVLLDNLTVLGDMAIQLNLTNPATDTYTLFIGQAGYFLVAYSFQADHGGQNLTITPLQNVVPLLEVGVNNPATATVAYALVQVVNPEAGAATMTLTQPAQATVNAFTLIVAPISSSVLLGPSNVPITPPFNPRARLGRINTFS